MTIVDVDDLELERIAALGWQAEHQAWVGRWLLRASDGFTGRANSVLPLGHLDLDLDEALDEVTAWYAGYDLPPRCAVPAPARDDLRAALAARGWTPSWGANVMVAPSHRRRGLASRVLGGLARWGQARGATGAYLQVAHDNEIALAWYRRAGFADHHTYDYFDPPAA